MYFFLLGFLFALMVQPIAEGITTLILTFFELLKSKMAIKINKHNQLIQGGGNSSTNAIGFCAPDDNYEEEEDDEY